jgi:pimeloyl-ACP methyl ester carboxylesterase
VTIPKLASEEAGKLLARIQPPADAARWSTQRTAMRQRLARTLHGGEGTPPAAGTDNVPAESSVGGASRTITINAEPFIRLTAVQAPADPKPSKLAIVLDLQGAEQASRSEVAAALRGAGWTLVTLDLRATGALAVAQSRVGRAPDHHPAEWALWIGRPLLGQWVADVQRTLDALGKENGTLPPEVAVIGLGPAGLVAIAAGALEPRISRVAAIGSLASYVTDVPYEKQWLGLMAPKILQEVGDVAHVAALVAPRPLIVAAPVTGGGETLGSEAATGAFSFTRRAYAVENAVGSLVVRPSADAGEIVRLLTP